MIGGSSFVQGMNNIMAGQRPKMALCNADDEVLALIAVDITNIAFRPFTVEAMITLKTRGEVPDWFQHNTYLLTFGADLVCVDFPHTMFVK